MMRTLTDLWPALGIDERLSIVLEQLDAETQRLTVKPVGPNDRSNRTAYLAGYQTALRDLRHYVVDGHAPPTLEEFS